MRGFILGLLVGGAAGAAAAYAVLERSEAGDLEVLTDAAEQIGSMPESEPDETRRRGRRGKTRRRARGDGGDGAPPELSAADRAMVWRGPAVTMPARDVDFAEGVAGRPLNQPEINQGIGGRRRELTDCIIEARGSAELTANMTLKFLVDGNGRVSKARVRAPAYLQKRGLHGCVDRVTRSMRFSATGAPTVVTLPFELAY